MCMQNQSISLLYAPLVDLIGPQVCEWLPCSGSRMGAFCGISQFPAFWACSLEFAAFTGEKFSSFLDTGCKTGCQDLLAPTEGLRIGISLFSMETFYLIPYTWPHVPPGWEPADAESEGPRSTSPRNKILSFFWDHGRGYPASWVGRSDCYL